jgi:ribose-phosphate pyrophosphokinase
MEMLIMISACKGGSSKSITGKICCRDTHNGRILTSCLAVVPYFPYSRQSKKKSHRGAITARMVANLMHIAGVNHVITMDLHASQMQGFFKCPVDNLVAEPLLAKWIRRNIPDWADSVVVSKNPGGSKRVTSMADALKLSFGIITTDRRRPYPCNSMMNSAILDPIGLDGVSEDPKAADETESQQIYTHEGLMRTHTRSAADPSEQDFARPRASSNLNNGHSQDHDKKPTHSERPRAVTNLAHRNRLANGNDVPPSPLARSTRIDSIDSPELPKPGSLRRTSTAIGVMTPNTDEDGYESPAGDEDDDERARDVITGRLIHGHLVDDDAPSPSISAMSGYAPHANGQRHSSDDELPDAMTQSFMSVASSRRGAPGLGGTGDAADEEEEEEEALQNPEIETTITLVGNVRNKPVILIDDMIDKAGSWIAAAETVVKRGGATKVYCMATHGLFGGDALQELENCEQIDKIIVTNSYPIPPSAKEIKKLVVLDVSGLLSEAIRRNNHGESISALYRHFDPY